MKHFQEIKIKMDYVPNTHRIPSLVFNGYIFMKGKENKDDSINWRCQNSSKKGVAPCPVTCTTLNGDFKRFSPMRHLNSQGKLIHEPPTSEKQHSMQFIEEVKQEVSKKVDPLRQFYEISIDDFIAEQCEEETGNNFDFERFAIICPEFDNTRRGLSKIVVKKLRCFQRLIFITLMVNTFEHMEHLNRFQIYLHKTT